MLLFGISGDSGGLGQVQCEPGYVWNESEQACDYPTVTGQCSAGSVWNAAEGACDWPTNVPAGGSAQGASSTPWWATLTTAVAQGVTTGVKAPAKPMTPIAAPAWYTTPIGIGGIALGIVALVLLLKR